MNTHLFYAVDNAGNTLLPLVEKTQEGYYLTFKKEMLEGVQALRLLPELARAEVGDNGFFITPRNIVMSGDLLVRFLPREDTSYRYENAIMSCYGFKTAEGAALVRIERNYKYEFCISVQDGIYSVETVFDFTKHDPVYDDIRVMILPLKEDATLGDFAATERNLRLAQGEIVPLTEKCKRPAAEYAAAQAICLNLRR